ncbi:MAG: hypothetical protein KGI28_00410 [Thaumarchaeota archaeon]|nr:hypothetical protein [Nitrososphaerota archaeon]
MTPLIFLPLIFCGLIIPAFALNVNSVELDAQNTPVVVPSGTPAIVSIPNGFIHGQITTSSEPSQITSGLRDFVYQETRTTDGSFISFDGVLENQTETINVFEDGQVAYSLVLEPKQEVKQVQQDPIVVPLWVYGLGAVAGCSMIGVVWWRKNSEDG